MGSARKRLSTERCGSSEKSDWVGTSAGCSSRPTLFFFTLLSALGDWPAWTASMVSFVFQPLAALIRGCCSVTKSGPTLWPHRLQHARLPCPILCPRVCSNSCPLCWYAMQRSHPLSPPSPLAFNLSQCISVFPNELALPIRWPKYWSFSFSISPSNKYTGLIFFRIDHFDLLPVQGTLKRVP